GVLRSVCHDPILSTNSVSGKPGAVQSVGLEQIGDEVWAVYFGPVHLGWLDEADYRIMDVKERARRNR
ncbi:hypothetical protein WI372_06370, partial [Gemmatimonadota bacterium DH-20]